MATSTTAVDEKVAAAPSSADQAAVLGYSEEVASVFQARRDYAATRLAELNAMLKSMTASACDCSDEMKVRFL